MRDFGERVSSPMVVDGVKRMMSVRFAALFTALVMVSMVSTFSVSNVSASHSGSVVCDPTTSHCYEYVPAKTSWGDAKLAAEGMTHNGAVGHLATLTSVAETSFIATHVSDAIIQRSDEGPFEGGAWIGASAVVTDNTPGITTDDDFSYSWSWVNGEPWGYTNWSSGEPNWGDDAAHFWHSGPPLYTVEGHWNNAGSSLLKGYLVEYEPH